MFEATARANIHHQQALILLKQLPKLHSTLLYDAERISSIEKRLFAHIYALLDADSTECKSAVQALVRALAFLTDKTQTITTLIDCYQNALHDESEDSQGFAKAIVDIMALLPASYLQQCFSASFDTTYIENVLYRENDTVNILKYVYNQWPQELVQIARQSALELQFTPSHLVACILWNSDNVTSQELAQGYQHSEFVMAKASFAKGLATEPEKANAALFQRFARTTNTAEKSALLTLAGASSDIRWLEPCSLFCQEHPEYAFTVLCHFQHKHFLTMIIKLMSVAQCAQAAYQAWLLLTNKPLQQKPQLQDTNNKQNVGNDNTLANENHAEQERQNIMQIAGAKVLAGISFNNNNAYEKLQGLQGLSVQSALMLSQSSVSPSCKAIAFYQEQLSSHSFTALVANIEPEQQANTVRNAGAAHVA